MELVKEINSNNKSFSMISEVRAGQGDRFILRKTKCFSLTKDLPLEISVRMNISNPVNDEGR
jgi:hypothetical protein